MSFGHFFQHRNPLVCEPKIDTKYVVPIISTRISDRKARVILRRAKAVAAQVEEGREFALVIVPEKGNTHIESIALTVSLIEQAPRHGLHSTYVLATEVGFKKMSPAPAN